jgi:hypothetical protein
LLTLCRNKCAHSERIYNFRSGKIALQDHPWHARLGIPHGPSGYIHGKQDLLAILIALKILLDREDYRRLSRDIGRAIGSLDKALHVVASSEVLSAMGFVANWQQLASF